MELKNIAQSAEMIKIKLEMSKMNSDNWLSVWTPESLFERKKQHDIKQKVAAIKQILVKTNWFSRVW